MAATLKQVKTYRVRHDGMKVGDSVRNFGDLMPEAIDFEPMTIRSLLSTGRLEEIWVDQSVVDDWEKDRKKREGARAPKETADSEEEGETPKKKTVKKTAAKKIVKKGKSNG